MSEHEREDVDTVIHLGAGDCRELNSHLSRAGRVILVEARPDAAAALQCRNDGGAVTVVNAVIDGEGRQGKAFQVFNLAEASSLREPTGYLQIAPGLETTRRLSAETVRASRFLSDHLGEDETAVVVIDLAGEEATVLDDLAESGVLARLAEVKVHCGAAPLYDGAEDAKALSARLEAAGFDTVQADGAGPRRVLTASRTVSAKAAADRRAAEEEAAQARNALRSRLETVENERDVALSRAETLESDLAGRDEKIKTLTERAEKAEEAAKDAGKERDEALSRAEALESDLAGRDEKIKTLTKQVDQAAERAAKAQSDVAVALRMQAVARGDLDDLRQRYGKALEIKREQDTLLSRLTERLSDASRYLADMPEGGDPRKLASGGDAEKKAGSGKTSSKKKRSKKTS